jgi:hypothetical protein
MKKTLYFPVDFCYCFIKNVFYCNLLLFISCFVEKLVNVLFHFLLKYINSTYQNLR